MLTRDARMVHTLIEKTAKEMAGAYYEIAASKDNVFYRDWPVQRNFIRRNWRHFVLAARQTLTDMLARPNYPEATKRQIYNALILDSGLPYSTQENQIVNVPH